MGVSDKSIPFIGLYDTKWLIKHKSDIIPENSAIAIHDSDSSRDFYILGDGKSTIGELELSEIGSNPLPNHSLDFELVKQKEHILYSVREIVSAAIDEEMKSFTDNDSEINQVPPQYVQSLLHSIERNILGKIDSL